MSEPEPSERPEGLETRPPTSPAVDAERPDWLVGAGDVLERGAQDEAITRPKISDAPAQRAALKVVPGGKPEPPKGWSGASSSVPKLSVLPAREPAADEDDVELHDEAPSPDRDLDLVTPEGGDSATPARTAPAFRPLDEPWYLVWAEALLTNRRVQTPLLIALVALTAFMLWPRHGAGASLGSILHHPERYQGRTVSVHGEVMEIFEVGIGHAFQLRQGRDVVVVYSTIHEPRVHDHVTVAGTVSTGYLDGQPRVAIFEGNASP